MSNEPVWVEVPESEVICSYPECRRMRKAKSDRCAEHHAICRFPGCSEPKRKVQASKYCLQHATSISYQLRQDSLTDATCELCRKVFTYRAGLIPSVMPVMCPGCRAAHLERFKRWRKHGVRNELMVRWALEPRCWICTLPIDFAAWGTELGKQGASVDHDHRCCPGNYGCANCVRGLAHQGCNLLVGQLEKALRDWGADRFRIIVRVVMDSGREGIPLR